MDGILVIWKPRGMTSHDVIFKLRRILKMKKIGHTGTLDPEVDGVLVVCLGQATKLVEFLMDGGKSYYGEITLGFSTETEDAHGEIVERVPINTVPSEEKIDQNMQLMEGEITQIPPYYSAIKVKGRRLYEYAREGIVVERPKRTVHVTSFKRTSPTYYDLKEQTVSWQFKVECGKGTYVRTLAVDLGKKLGYPSHMSKLTRTSTGGFNQKDAVTLEDVQSAMDNNTIKELLYPIERALTEFTSFVLTERQFELVRNGQVLESTFFNNKIKDLTVMIYQNRAIGIYYPHPTKKGYVKPRKMFQTNIEKGLGE